MYQSVPFVAQDKSFVGKKVAHYSEGHPINRTGQIDGAETFPFEAGTVMGEITTGPKAGKLCRYANTREDGGEVAIGIIEEQIDSKTVNGTTHDIITSYIVHGLIYEAQCVGLDANAKADLKGQIIFI
ncbi:MAG TPA: hypothetical protein PKK26_03830 [Candidatus Wallbacteria bacterium]|nr:hypothetical protein [Candidatus Wallbacteria bacterium]